MMNLFNKHTLSEVLDSYEESLRERDPDSKLAGLVKCLKFQIACFGAGNRPVKSLDNKFFQQFATFLKNGGGNRSRHKLKYSSARLYYKVLRCALNYASERKWLASNPAPSLKSVGLNGTGKSERCYLTGEELARLKATPCRSSIVRDAFMFSCFTGLRISDLRRLKRSDISFESGIAVLLGIIIKKTSNWISIPISDAAREWLPDKEGMLFGDLPNISTIERILGQWAADAGLEKHITMHIARHSFATMLINNKVDIYTVSKLLGHSDVRTTSIYARLMDRTMEEAIESLNGIMKSLPA